MESHQHTVSKWLEFIGKDRGLHLTLDEDKHCTIQFGDELECIIEVPDRTEITPVYIYSSMLKLPPTESEQLVILKSALQMNMFGLQTGSSLLSLDQRTDHIVLTFSCDIDMLNQELFSQVLGEFLDLACELSNKFKEINY